MNIRVLRKIIAKAVCVLILVIPMFSNIGAPVAAVFAKEDTPEPPTDTPTPEDGEPGEDTPTEIPVP